MKYYVDKKEHNVYKLCDNGLVCHIYIKNFDPPPNEINYIDKRKYHKYCKWVPAIFEEGLFDYMIRKGDVREISEEKVDEYLFLKML